MSNDYNNQPHENFQEEGNDDDDEDGIKKMKTSLRGPKCGSKSLVVSTLLAAFF